MGRSPFSPNPQAASLAWRFGENFAVSATLSSALRVEIYPCVLSSGYALGYARVLRVCKHPHAPAYRHTTRSRWRLPMPLARRLAAPQSLHGSAYRPALYFRDFCLGLLAECPRWQFPINHHHKITWRQTTFRGTTTGLHSRFITSETSPVVVLHPPAYYGYLVFLITRLL